MIIIGITGTYSAGKGVIVDYLKSKGFNHFSVRAFLTEELEKEGRPVNRNTLIDKGNELREKNRASHVAEVLYRRAAACGGNCIIESIRNPGEVSVLRKKGAFFLLAVDADPEKRYAWAIARGSITDNVTFDEFIAQEQREMHSTDPNKQNLFACIGAADYKFVNDGKVEDLHRELDKFLQKIKA